MRLTAPRRRYAGVSTPPDLELEPDEFRQVPTKPLGNPRKLRLWVAFFLAVSIACAGIAAWQGGFWVALTPIPAAMWAGAALAGLWPRWFFGKGDDDDPIA